MFNQKLIIDRLEKIITQDMSIKRLYSVNDHFEEQFPFCSLNLI